MTTDFVGKVLEFNEVAGTGPEFDTRKVALYTGLQLEEMCEKIEAINHPKMNLLVEVLTTFGNSFKAGHFDDLVENIDKVAALDADVDLAVVALGGACAMGADVDGACHEVMDSNLSKFPIVEGIRVALKDQNGKIMKPPGYRPPNLMPFVSVN